MPADITWLNVIQTIGIVGGLFFTGYNIARDVKQKKISNLIELNKSHRDIWKEILKDKSLDRVTEKFPNLEVDPLTSSEEIFVIFVILHSNCTFILQKSELAYDIEKFRKDFNDFLSLPIPKIVWTKMRPYQNKDFISFVEHGKIRKKWFDYII